MCEYDFTIPTKGRLEELSSANAQQQYAGRSTLSSIEGVEAGKVLARMLEIELGYIQGHIDNIALRLLIQAKWREISALAHTIHKASL